MLTEIPSIKNLDSGLQFILDHTGLEIINTVTKGAVKLDEHDLVELLKFIQINVKMEPK